MKMQRITNSFFPFMNTQQPFQIPFIQDKSMSTKISTTHFQRLMKEFIKTRYPLRDIARKPRPTLFNQRSQATDHIGT